MTSKQQSLYWRRWAAALRGLQARGAVPTPLPSAEADTLRHNAHLSALGYQRSSKLLTNTELDAVLAHFLYLALPSPRSLDEMQRLQAQPQHRCRWVCEQLCEEIATTLHAAGKAAEAEPLTQLEPYLRFLLRRASTPKFREHLDLDTFPLASWHKVIAMLDQRRDQVTRGASADPTTGAKPPRRPRRWAPKPKPAQAHTTARRNTTPAKTPVLADEPF